MKWFRFDGLSVRRSENIKSLLNGSMTLTVQCYLSFSPAILFSSLFIT